jgi:hypothetical protein
MGDSKEDNWSKVYKKKLSISKFEDHSELWEVFKIW